MLRKLIMLAVTSGLAKKAWDSYRNKNAAGTSWQKERAAAASRPAKWTARTPASDTRPDAN